MVFLVLQLFLVARIGFRAVARVLDVISPILGIKKAPCTQTIINWVTSLSIVRIKNAGSLKGLPLISAPFTNGLIWMIDVSIGLGSGKILTVLALDAHHYQLHSEAPGFKNVHCVGVAVAESWTGERICDFLKRLISVTGRPAAYLKDGGTDLAKAVKLLKEQGLGSLCINDISHVSANLLKHRYENNLNFKEFISVCGKISSKIKQTVLACLCPPKQRTKGRFMSLHRLVSWADRVLKLSPTGRASKGSILSKLREALDKLPSCKKIIRSFMNDAMPLMECHKIFKTKGLNQRTFIECEELILKIPSMDVRNGISYYLNSQLEVAKKLGLENIGMPICSDQIESLFGIAKQHGTGEIKDADRIALRIPSLAGVPTKEEAGQILGLSLAEKKEIIGPCMSLTKLRRLVLNDPLSLEVLGSEQTLKHLELIPHTKNRTKNDEIHGLSMVCIDAHDPESSCQAKCNSGMDGHSTRHTDESCLASC